MSRAHPVTHATQGTTSRSTQLAVGSCPLCSWSNPRSLRCCTDDVYGVRLGLLPRLFLVEVPTARKKDFITGASCTLGHASLTMHNTLPTHQHAVHWHSSKTHIVCIRASTVHTRSWNILQY